ncbi:MAG: EAL domain-containing protein [Spirochaetales bacterium]|nr:EAL domain-containing protein [Spirochaetales bacterium]
MPIQRLLPLILIGGSALGSAFLGFSVLATRVGRSGARRFGALSLAIAWWGGLNLLEHLARGLQAKLVLGNLEYLGIVSVPVLWHSFGRAMKPEDESGTKRGLSPWLFAPSVIVAVLVWLDPVLGLVRSDFRLLEASGIAPIGKTYGPVFWVWSAWSYFLILSGTYRLLSWAVRTIRARFVVAASCFAVALPIMANAAYVLGLRPFGYHDPTTVAFCVSGFFLGYTVFRFRLRPFVGAARRALVDRSRNGIIIVDGHGRIEYANASADRSLGDIPPHESYEALRARLGEKAGLPPVGVDADHLDLSGGSWEAAWVPVAGRSGKPRGWALILHDETRRASAETALRETNEDLERLVAIRTSEAESAVERLREELDTRKQTEKQLFFYSLHDSLTGLPNRSLLLNRLDLAVQRMRRDRAWRFAVLFLDFDDFKRVNDTYGHSMGDAFLREVAGRLVRCVRTVDTVARLGGDEFVVLLDEARSIDEAREVAERISEDLAVPIFKDGRSIIPSASVGVLFPERDYRNPEDVLRDADIAMYEAKGTGKNRFAVFEERMRLRVQERSRLVDGLSEAIVTRAIGIAYQPIVDLATRETVGREALARWRHPVLGTVEPEVFIPIAENSGLAQPLGIYVLREACAAAQARRNGHPEEETRHLSVNVSAVQLTDPGFPDTVLGVLERTGFPANSLYLEITENALMTGGDVTKPGIDRLRAAGVRFELDDFGTGYSSLSYLHRFPVDIIKVDRSFVSDLAPDDPEGMPKAQVARGIVKGIISLAHEFGIKIIAEGIETEEQAELLLGYGADFGQGFLFGRPEVGALVEEELPDLEGADE